MPTRIGRRTHPFAPAGGSDCGEPLTRCRAHLLFLIQHVCARLFEKWAPLFAHLDRSSQRDGARDVWHFTNDFQRRIFTASWLEIEAERLGKNNLGNSQVVLGGNE